MKLRAAMGWEMCVCLDPKLEERRGLEPTWICSSAWSARGFRDYMDFCEELERALARKVDVVTEDGLSPFIRDQVLAEALPL